MAQRILALSCRFLLAAVFLMAAVTKLTDLPGFRNQLDIQSGLPESLTLLLAAGLPWLELICGLCLAMGWAVREAALLLTLLLAGLLAYALTHLGQSDCGCFLFPGRTPQWAWWPPVRNALLLLSALWTAARR